MSSDPSLNELIVRILKLIAPASTVLLFMLGLGAWASGSVRGAISAILDQARGRQAFYSLGCTDAWPHAPRDFRERELLARDFHITFITIGGIAPSPYQANFAETYDSLSYWIMKRRFGSRFADDIPARAASDVYEHDISIEGCYWPSRELVTAAGDIIGINGQPDVLASLSMAEKKTIRIRGMILDIRGSKWRSWGRPEIRLARLRYSANRAEGRGARSNKCTLPFSTFPLPSRTLHINSKQNGAPA